MADATLQAADYRYVSSPESKWLIGIKKAEFTRGIPPLCFRGRQAPVCGSDAQGRRVGVKNLLVLPSWQFLWASQGSRKNIRAPSNGQPKTEDTLQGQHAAAGLPLRALLVDLPPLPVETPRQLHEPTASIRG